jgi:hypothetical protein
MRSMKNKQTGVSVIGWLVVVVIVVGVLFTAYVWLMLSWAYADGERAGWVQKLSRKGYLCKTWEGEMAMVSLPGSVPEKFVFTVRDDNVAQQINSVMGRRVSLFYEEHIGLPSSCFGETGHFVKGVKPIDDSPGGPLATPPQPAPAAPPATPQAPPAPQPPRQ